MDHDHVNISVDDAPSPGFERVPARRVGPQTYELLHSPVYALDVAAGDVVRVLDPAVGAFEIVKRGGNLGAHIYLHESEFRDAERTRELASHAAQLLEPVQGRVEAYIPGLVVCCAPVTAGFVDVDAIFEQVCRQFAGSSWCYTNVYDSDDQPIGWWDE